jgi:hypothetical protein
MLVLQANAFVTIISHYTEFYHVKPLYRSCAGRLA